MKAVVQRVSGARVRVGEDVAGEIGSGLCVLLGVAVATGVFGARMAVELINDGPVTIVL